MNDSLTPQTRQIIFDSLRTKKNSYLFIEALDYVSSNIYKGKVTSLEKHLEEISEDFKSVILEIARLQSVDLGNKSEVQKLFASLSDLLKSANVTIITLAFSPSESFINRLYVWFKTNLGGEQLLDVQVEPSVVGGLALIKEGHYVNLTLDKLLTDYFEANKNGLKDNIQRRVS